MRFLTTGSRSGLGRHIFETFGGAGWTRDLSKTERDEIKREGVDVIVHCAFNSRRNVDSESLYRYVADNVLLTAELASVPHKKFIFLSSVDVYPGEPGLRSESDITQPNALEGMYGVTKLMSEAIVRERCPNHLILRCVALLGKYARKNSLLRIIEDEPCVLTLSGDSRFNYVPHSDVSDFIGFAIENDVQGVYNVACSENVTLNRVAYLVGRRVTFGEHRYDVGNIDNSKSSLIFPAFKKTSEEVVAQFVVGRTKGGYQCV